AYQAAVEVVRPRVVRTLNAAGQLAGRLREDPRAAMAADVVERADRARGVAGDDDVVAVDLANEILPRLLRVFGSARVEPHRSEERVELARQERGIGVVARGKRARLLGHHVARIVAQGFVAHEARVS